MTNFNMHSKIYTACNDRRFNQEIVTFSPSLAAGNSNQAGQAPRIIRSAQMQSHSRMASSATATDQQSANKQLIAFNPQGGYFIIKQPNTSPQNQTTQTEIFPVQNQMMNSGGQYYFQTPTKMNNNAEPSMPLQMPTNSVGFQQFLQQNTNNLMAQQQQQHQQQQQQQQQQNVYQNIPQMVFVSNPTGLGAIQSDQLKFLTLPQNPQYNPGSVQEQQYGRYEYPLYIPQTNFNPTIIDASTFNAVPMQPLPKIEIAQQPAKIENDAKDAVVNVVPMEDVESEISPIVIPKSEACTKTNEDSEESEPSPEIDSGESSALANPCTPEKRSPKRLPEAKIKPNVLTHVIGGHVIREYITRNAMIGERKPSELENKRLDSTPIDESVAPKERAASDDAKPRIQVSQWSVADVSDRLKTLPLCSGYVDEFVKHELDGECLLMLNPEHLVVAMSLTLGTALKIIKEIKTLIQSNR